MYFDRARQARSMIGGRGGQGSAGSGGDGLGPTYLEGGTFVRLGSSGCASLTLRSISYLYK